MVLINKNKRDLIAITILFVLGFIRSKFVPWEIGMKSWFPLFVTYILLGGAIGNFYPYDLKQSITHGFLIGFLVYSVAFSWLFAVGFFKGTLGNGILLFILSIINVIIASILTKIISKKLKIEEN